MRAYGSSRLIRTLLSASIPELQTSIYNSDMSNKVTLTNNRHKMHRQAFRRTDDYTPGTPKVKLVEEEIGPLHPTAVLIKVHAVSLNYRDANIANGGNPWPVIPNGIPGNDAAGEIIAVGERVSLVRVGDRVAPITDSEYVTARSTGRSWLAANEDGTLATHIVFDEKLVTKLPDHLDWVQSSIVPCAGTTAWSALKGVNIGQTVLIQGMYMVFL